MRAKEFTQGVAEGSGNVIDFPIANVRRPNGAIGTQGVTTDQVASVIKNVAKLNVSPDMSMRQLVDALKADVQAQERLREFTKQNPIKVQELPDGTYHLLDGHHRTFLLNLLGDKTVPAVMDNQQDVAEERLDEVPLPPDWDPEKLNLRQTFKDRLKYALDRAKRLGGGSSRVAMTIDYEGRPTALKVAKNLKGLAQNEAEIEILQDGYAGRLPVVIPLIDYDKANKRPVWMQTEIAKKVTGPTLAKMLHAPALWFLTDVVKIKLGKADMYRQNTTVESMKKNYLDPRMWTSQKKTPTEQDWEIFMTYVDEVSELVSSTTLDIGDLNTPSNWGIFNNRPVIIDLGFTDETKGLYGFKE